MAKKRSKLDRSQRQADQLERKATRTPEQTPKKQPVRTSGNRNYGERVKGAPAHMHLAVTCKNVAYHSQQDPFHGYRIRVETRPAESFQVKCNSCGKTDWYEPQDVLELAD
jgi:hypothetical protein